MADFFKSCDAEGREYLNFFTNRTTDAVVKVGDMKNLAVRGEPKIVVRKGNSSFGEQLIIQFHVHEVIDHYDSSAKRDNIEIYFPLDEGMNLLRRVIATYDADRVKMDSFVKCCEEGCSLTAHKEGLCVKHYRMKFLGWSQEEADEWRREYKFRSGV